MSMELFRHNKARFVSLELLNQTVEQEMLRDDLSSAVQRKWRQAHPTAAYVPEVHETIATLVPFRFVYRRKPL